MVDVDVSTSTRLPVQTDLLTASSRSKDPVTLLRMFAQGLRHLYGRRPVLLLSTHGLAVGEFAIGLLVGEDGVERIGATEPWTGHGLPIHGGGCGGLLGGIVRRGTPRLLHHLDPRDDPVLPPPLPAIASSTACRSLVAVPIYEAGSPHNWLVLLDPAPEGFTLADLEELNLRANLVGAMINHLRVARQLHDAQVYIQREVERIAAIQRALLPPELPAIPGVALAASYATFDRAGGDLYDVRPARLGSDGVPDLWSLLIADASGHGPSAAVLTAVLDALLRSYANEPPGPADMLAYANRLLCGKRLGDAFVTAFLGLYEPATRTLAYAAAGHNPPLLRGPGVPAGRVSSLDRAGGLPLGIACEATYDVATVCLEPGSTLLLYTDGACEAMNPLGELLGMAPIEHVLAGCAGSPGELVEQLLGTLRRHECGRRPCDDQTLLALQLTA